MGGKFTLSPVLYRPILRLYGRKKLISESIKWEQIADGDL